ncbi:MAG: protoheme IX [Geobacteraceae bacterium]|nr:MAG: protoheme IX [Geobacteraceae bacterium]
MGSDDKRRGGWLIESGAQTGILAGRREGERDNGIISDALVLAKPGIVIATALAGFTGMVLAAQGLPGTTAALVTVTCLILAAAGAAMINNVLDAGLDLHMARLRGRTAALGRLGERRVFLAALAAVAVSLALAVCFLNFLTALLILAAVLSYTVLYTLWFKRRSPFGAVVGGIPGALPVLIGSAAATGSVGPGSLLLFLVMLLWQPPHFWTLALHCREEYAVAQVPVLPAVKGESFTITSIFLFTASLLPASLSLWHFGYCSGWYGGCASLLWVVLLAFWYMDIVKGRRFERAFRVSILYLTLLFLAIMVDVCVM